MSNKLIEAGTVFPSAADLMARLLEGGHLNPMAEERAVKQLGIEGQGSPKILGELKTNGAPIPGPETAKMPTIPNGRV